MFCRDGTLLSFCMLLLGIGCCPQRALARNANIKLRSDVSRVESLGLPPGPTAQLRTAISNHQYRAAERILLPAIAKSHDPALRARLLNFTGGVYYLDHDFLHAAVAWSKSSAIAPLPPTLQFSLAMTYVQLHRLDWAQPALQALARQYPRNALYPYWLGRIEYATHHYNHAIRDFHQAIQLGPDMANAYDNLGLCYYYLNENSKAIVNYKKAIHLNIDSGHPSAWPYLNLAITQEFLNQIPSAQKNLEESIRLNPNIPSAYFQLGNVLEHSGKLKLAQHEYQAAIDHDANYAEPHFALARIYQRLGEKARARNEVHIYMRLRHSKQSTAHRHATGD